MCIFSESLGVSACQPPVSLSGRRNLVPPQMHGQARLRQSTTAALRVQERSRLRTISSFCRADRFASQRTFLQRPPTFCPGGIGFLGSDPERELVWAASLDFASHFSPDLLVSRWETQEVRFPGKCKADAWQMYNSANKLQQNVQQCQQIAALSFRNGCSSTC